MIAPTAGTAKIGGFDVLRQPDAVRHLIGVVFQNNSLDKKLTVEENLRGQGNLYGLAGARLTGRVGEAMERLGLTDRRGDLAGKLSGGLRRRVEIAKALLHEPRLLLMDEPSTGLDPGARLEMWQYIAEFRRERRVTLVLTSHILDEADRCDRLLLLHQGKRVAEGSPEALKAKVGGDVIVVGGPDLAALQEGIRRRFRLNSQIVDGLLRIETAHGHRLVAELAESFPGAIHSVSVHKPTLEDVFLDETGASID
jgi:ABC-2 type transport system ATP-binding protein